LKHGVGVFLTKWVAPLTLSFPPWLSAEGGPSLSNTFKQPWYHLSHISINKAPKNIYCCVDNYWHAVSKLRYVVLNFREL